MTNELATKKGKIKAEMWDKMQYLFRSYYDRMIHTVLYYDGQINVDNINKAYQYILTNVPILRASFQSNPIRPFWRENKDFSAQEVVKIIETNDADTAINDFLTQEISAQSKYQIKVAIIRCNGKDALCQLVNHMCMDGGDVKQLNSKIVEAYNAYCVSDDISVVIKKGERSHYQDYSKFSDEEKKEALGLFKNVSDVKDKTRFPFVKSKSDNEDKSRIIKQKITAEMFGDMKQKGKAQGMSINDILLTAYMRALYKICQLDSNTRLSVPCMVDLRRHIDGDNSFGFSNHVGFVICTLDCRGETFADTLNFVHAELAKSKEDKFFGLYSLPLLHLAYKIFPQFISEFAIRIGYSNPYTGMSNIGQLKEEDYTMNGLKLVNAFMTGAIKFKPYMQLAISTFKDEMTMSIAVRCNDIDEQNIQKFLKDIVDEMKSF